MATLSSSLYAPRMPHYSSLVALLVGFVGCSLATESLVAGGPGEKASGPVEAHEISALDLDQICEHYPWLMHCQGRPS